MSTTTAEAPSVAKKKTTNGGSPEPKRYGTLIRVSDAFADAVRRASGFEDLSVAEFCEKNLLPVVERRYREAVQREAKRLEGGKN